ncbi:MAG: S-adenosylmethionine:tRNA ribosyltransferase-isomerase, partial [bacterium]
MRTEELNYNLPEELIAQAPAEPRDSSRLLVCRRTESDFETHVFRELPNFLNAGDAIVLNTARVMHARLYGYKHPTGAKIEVLLLERLPGDKARYRALLRRKRRLEPGDKV